MTLRFSHGLRALLLAACVAAPAVAQEEARTALRARLAALAERERRLSELTERLAAAAEGTTAPVASQASSQAGELAFERARLAAARSRAGLELGAEPPEGAQEMHPAPAAEPRTTPVANHTEAPAAAEPAAPAASAEAQAPHHGAAPVRLAEALLAAGDAAAALEAFRSAAEEAEGHGDAAGAARARYGLARSLERLGRLDEALPAYAAVEGAPDAGPWAAAARFARGFIAWRRRLGEVSSQGRSP